MDAIVSDKTFECVAVGSCDSAVLENMNTHVLVCARHIVKYLKPC